MFHVAMHLVIREFCTSDGRVRHCPPPIGCVNSLPCAVWEWLCALIRVISFWDLFPLGASCPSSTAVVNEQCCAGHVQICDLSGAVASRTHPIIPRLYSRDVLAAVWSSVVFRSLVGGNQMPKPSLAMPIWLRPLKAKEPCLYDEGVPNPPIKHTQRHTHVTRLV